MRREKNQGFSWPVGISGYALLLGALVINILIQGGGFFRVSSFGSLLSSNLPLILAACAQMVIMLAGGIDISIGNTMALVNGIAIVLANLYEVPVGASWLIALAAGTAVGLANGLIIAYFRIPPLLVTFAMSTFIKGVSLIVLPKPGGTVPKSIYGTYTGSILGIPTAIWLISIAVLLLLLLSKFKISKYFSAVGSSERNSYASGIHVEKVKVLSYTLGGLIASLAGLSLTALTASGDVRIGEAFALQSIAAVIIGGTLKAGKWRSYVFGAVSGALFLAIVNNIVFFIFNILAMKNPGLQISTYYQQLLSNLIIIMGLASAVFMERSKYKKLKRIKNKGGNAS